MDVESKWRQEQGGEKVLLWVREKIWTIVENSDVGQVPEWDAVVFRPMCEGVAFENRDVARAEFSHATCTWQSPNDPQKAFLFKCTVNDSLNFLYSDVCHGVSPYSVLLACVPKGRFVTMYCI